MDLEGKRLSDIKDRKSFPGKIACILRDMKVDGWVEMDIYHLNTFVYRMYKTLADMFNNELKSALLNQKPNKSSEMLISPKPNDAHSDVKPDAHSCESFNADAMSIVPKEETKSEDDLKSEIAMIEE